VGELESRLNGLVEILRHVAERGDLVLSFCDSIHLGPESFSDIPGVDELLCNLAYDLEFYDQDRGLLDMDTYGDRKLVRKITKALNELRALGVTLPESAYEFL
jgi:hypothetical protein